jgi:hypothetical protein
MCCVVVPTATEKFGFHQHQNANAKISSRAERELSIDVTEKWGDGWKAGASSCLSTFYGLL